MDYNTSHRTSDTVLTIAPMQRLARDIYIYIYIYMCVCVIKGGEWGTGLDFFQAKR